MIKRITRINNWRGFGKGTNIVCALLLCSIGSIAQKQKEWKPLEINRGKVNYYPDSLGNRIVDFSYCGYKASEEAIPTVPVKMVVPLTKGDATLRIQSALDYVAGLPVDKNGFRGTVLLQKGTYEVAGQLQIKASGVVLRGSGMGTDGTTLFASGKDRQTLIRVLGKNDRTTGNAVRIADAYVPVNAFSFSVENANAFKTGDNIIIHRPSTKNWIEILGTWHFGGGITSLGWKPGEREIFWDRKIVAVNGNKITIDAPLTTALDTTYGGGYVSTYNWPGRINNIGIENLRCVSDYDKTNPKDEAHRWMAITMENVSDAWVRQVVFEHFAGSAVDVLSTANRVTVEDCKSLQPVSEIGGQRRYTFLTTGGQTLFQRCYAEDGYHDFSVGYTAPGPNAFVQCYSELPHNFSGAIDSWASGVLFDVVTVDGNALRFGNRWQDGQGAGWAAANSVFWECSAARVDCYQPPTAQNYSFASWAQFAGDGYWDYSNEHINPRSLYYTQLQDRLQKNVNDRSFIQPFSSEASSSPSVEVAAELTALAANPLVTLEEWIDTAPKRNPISTNSTGAKTLSEADVRKPMKKASAPVMQVSNGWLVRGNEIVVGDRQDVQWWNGSVLPSDLRKMKPHITRFVPGKTGTGLTDDLDAVTDTMQMKHIVAMEHNYALWYERRRDDHERIRRMDGEVWPAFYELPFARTGEGFAWDGLSKYDLTKYNPWYWSRLKHFANLADEKGLVLIHQNYFQHNIIEAGAHYADFPWRPVNNVNNTGFPEPVPYAGDKRVFMAEQFYDVANPVRRKLHTAYIRKCLDNFKDNTGVIQLIGAEFTGPLHFVQFWTDVVKDWEKETGKNEIIGLSTTKDVQDAILADPVRSKTIDLVDIRYWHYQADGSAYEPKGGQNLAPRQHARLLKPKKTSFEQVYRAVSEYRLKYPGKAVMYSGDSYDQFGWAAFMGGGSLADIPPVGKQMLTDATSMKPLTASGKQYVLSDDGKAYIIYTTNGKVDFAPAAGNYVAKWINPSNGKVIKEEDVEGGRLFSQESPQREAVLWIRKK